MKGRTIGVLLAVLMVSVIGLSTLANGQDRRQAAQANIPRWEYRIVWVQDLTSGQTDRSRAHTAMQTAMNRMGAEGWEFVQGNGALKEELIFKRPVQR